MSELKSTLVKLGKAALPLAVAFSNLAEPSSSQADSPQIIKSVPKGSQTIQIEGDFPSAANFNENFRINNDDIPTLSRKTKREALSDEYANAYYPVGLEVGPEGIKTAIDNSLYEGAFDKEGNINLRKVVDAPFNLGSFAASKSNNQIMLVGGTADWSKNKAAVLLTEDKGKNWQTFELESGSIDLIKITPDNKYAFLYPDNRYSTATQPFTVYRLDLEKKSIETYTIPNIERNETITVATDFTHNQALNIYTQIFGSNKHGGYYIISYYSEGRLGVNKYEISKDPGSVAREITPFVNRNNVFTIWYTTANGRVIEIQNDKATRTIHSRGKKTAVYGSAQIRDVVIDLDKDVAYLGTQHYARNTKPGDYFIYNPHIETINLTHTSSDTEWIPGGYLHQYGDLLPDVGEIHNSDGAIRNLDIINRQGEKILVAAFISRVGGDYFRYNGIYHRDITGGKSSREPWKKIIKGFRAVFPQI